MYTLQLRTWVGYSLSSIVSYCWYENGHNNNNNNNNRYIYKLPYMPTEGYRGTATLLNKVAIYKYAHPSHQMAD